MLCSIPVVDNGGGIARRTRRLQVATDSPYAHCCFPQFLLRVDRWIVAAVAFPMRSP
jgi:hypothetical protein